MPEQPTAHEYLIAGFDLQRVRDFGRRRHIARVGPVCLPDRAPERLGRSPLGDGAGRLLEIEGEPPGEAGVAAAAEPVDRRLEGLPLTDEDHP